jgi:hypothetical protein
MVWHTYWIINIQTATKTNHQGGDKMETFLAFGHIVFYAILWIA